MVRSCRVILALIVASFVACGGVIETDIAVPDLEAGPDAVRADAGSDARAATPTIVPGPSTGYGSFDLRNVIVVAAGDTNGDGFADIVTSTLGDNANGANVAVLHVYLGGPTGLSSTSVDLMSQGTTFYSYRGPITAAAAGDVNDDGYAAGTRPCRVDLTSAADAPLVVIRSSHSRRVDLAGAATKSARRPIRRAPGRAALRCVRRPAWPFGRAPTMSPTSARNSMARW